MFFNETTTMKNLNEKSNLLNNIVKARTILKEKLNSMKLNEIDRINAFDKTFKPITQPLNVIAQNLNKRGRKKRMNDFEQDVDDYNESEEMKFNINNKREKCNKILKIKRKK